MYGVYALAISAALLFIIFQFFKLQMGLKIAIVRGEVTFLLLLFLCALWLILCIGMSDLCIDPVNNILGLVPAGEVHNTTAYFSTCAGQNSLLHDVNTAKSYTSLLNTTVYQLLYTPGSSCAGDQGLIEIRAASLRSYSVCGDVEAAVACQPVKAILEDFLFTGVCNQLFSGILSIWSSQLVTSFLLFLLLILGSISYQYFDPRIEFSGHHLPSTRTVAVLPVPVSADADVRLMHSHERYP